MMINKPYEIDDVNYQHLTLIIVENVYLFALFQIRKKCYLLVSFGIINKN
jgi:hypothetical protein